MLVETDMFLKKSSNFCQLFENLKKIAFPEKSIVFLHLISL